jgi:hypothetical protein
MLGGIRAAGQHRAYLAHSLCWRIHYVGTRHSTHSTRTLTLQRVYQLHAHHSNYCEDVWEMRSWTRKEKDPSSGRQGEGRGGRQRREGRGGRQRREGRCVGKCEAGQGRRQTSLLAHKKALANRPAVDDADFAARMDQKPTALSGLQRQLLV